MMNRLATALVAAALALSSGATAAPPAHTGDILVKGVSSVDGSQLLRTVSYSQSALSSDAGRRELKRRLSFAINSLCDESVSATTDPIGSLKCNSSAWTEVRAQLKPTMLAMR